MSAIPLIKVTLLNVVIESFLYGVYFVLNAGSFVLMIHPRYENPSGPQAPWRRRFKQVLRKPMFIGAAFLFIGVTGHWITTVIRMFTALTKYKEGTAPQEYYADISQDIYTIKTAFIEVGVIVADAMLIYRLWLAYGKNYYIITPPLLTLLGFTVCSLELINDLAHYPPGRSIFFPQTQLWGLSAGGLTLVTNVYSTTMIALRLFRAEYQGQSTGARIANNSTSHKNIMAIFIESALLYTAWTIIFIITFAAESHVEAMMTDCWAVIAGISFGLINVRIGMGWAKPCSIASTSTFTFHRFRIGDSHQATMDETPHQMQTLAVHVNMTQSSPEAVSFPDNHPDRGSAHSGQDHDRLKEDELEV